MRSWVMVKIEWMMTVLRKRKADDVKHDVYSVGCIEVNKKLF